MSETHTTPDWIVQARQAFAKQRFGIFIHWGFYANYAQGEHYLREAGLDEATYARMMYGFYPSKYDATEWVRIFKEAGAKYVTFTSRHHDGFAMWPSKVDGGYNIANTPFKRDIVGELADACRTEGLQLNLYYSLMDWHRRDYPANGWQSKQVNLPGRQPNYPSYKAYMMAQIAELIDAYHPGNMWFDGEWDFVECRDGEWIRWVDWELDDIYDLIHSKKVLVANNNHQPIREKEDIQLFERDLPGEGTVFSLNQPLIQGLPVEQSDVIQYDVWGYRIGETRFRSADDVVGLVVRAAAKGSNLLLNIGPDGTGQLPARAVEVLHEVGAWFQKNGESIYDTDGCPLANGRDIVTTRRGNTVYVHFLNPAENRAVLKLGCDVESACMLATGAPVAVSTSADGEASLEIKREAGDVFDVVVKLNLK